MLGILLCQGKFLRRSLLSVYYKAKQTFLAGFPNGVASKCCELNYCLASLVAPRSQLDGEMVSIFCQIIAHNASGMIFCIWIKINVSFSRYLRFFVFEESANQKFFEVIIDITVDQKLHF